MDYLQSEFFKHFRFRAYLFANGAVVLAVIAIFHWIADREIAAVFAGSLFILSPLTVLYIEGPIQRAWKGLSFLGALVFLLISALPIFLLRITHWGEPFSQLSLFGFSGPELHQFSNIMFLVMLLGFVVDSLRIKKLAKG